MHTELSIVIPAWNEAQRLGPTVNALAGLLSGIEGRHEILIVNDGSTDATGAVCEKLSQELSSPALEVRSISHAPNRGKGYAVRRGMLEARGRWLVMCDADGSTPPDELWKLLQPLRSGRCEIAIGSRYVAGARVEQEQPWFRRAWSRVCNVVVQRTLVPGIEDTQCGFKAFERSVARDLFRDCEVDGWAFDLEVLALARRRNVRVLEVGVRWQDDARSRVEPVRDVVRIVGETLRIHLRLLDEAPA